MCAKRLVRVEVGQSDWRQVEAASFAVNVMGRLEVRGADGGLVALFDKWVGVYYVDAK